MVTASQIEERIVKNNIDEWRRYRPSDPQYIRYYENGSNYILAGIKIGDIYEQISLARASLIYLDVENYGQLISKHDDMHLLMIRSKFLFDALALYNYCIDLSWQFLYLVCGDAHKGIIFDEKYYLQSLKECDAESLEGRLVKICGLKELHNKTTKFFNDPLTKEIREAYNYIKHRGTYHIEGLGLNDTHAGMSFNGQTIPFITRRTMNLNDFTEKLIEFDDNYFKYFSDLISETMPLEYLSGEINFIGMVNYAFTYTEWLKK